MPGRFMETVNPAFSMASLVLLITTPEILTLKNIKNSIMVFKELNYPISKLRIILNKATKLGISRKDVESTLGYEIFCEIPEDINVSFALFCTINPIQWSFASDDHAASGFSAWRCSLVRTPAEFRNQTPYKFQLVHPRKG